MIKREDLKKGDIILKIANSMYSKDRIPEEVIVTSIGPKYITVNYIDGQGKPYGFGTKFNNDERMGMKDWSQWKLFLGTKEEYQQELENQKKCSELYCEIDNKLYSGLGYEKLLAIKAIIDSDDYVSALRSLALAAGIITVPSCNC